eukprot:8697419-Pyramimonas_sp.AAC.1
MGARALSSGQGAPACICRTPVQTSGQTVHAGAADGCQESVPSAGASSSAARAFLSRPAQASSTAAPDRATTRSRARPRETRPGLAAALGKDEPDERPYP